MTLIAVATEGFTLRKGVIEQIRVAYEKRGHYYSYRSRYGCERIRRVLTKGNFSSMHNMPFVPRDEAYANDDIGIEQASPESIIKALSVFFIQNHW